MIILYLIAALLMFGALACALLALGLRYGQRVSVQEIEEYLEREYWQGRG